MPRQLVLFILLLAGCAQNEQSGQDTAQMLERLYPCSATIPTDDGTPTALVIGDSISIGYTPFLTATTTHIVHNPCNAMTSDYTRDNLGAWLSARAKFETITFNNGMWDINEWCRVPIERYAANLRLIGTAIKSKTDHPYFILTTQVLSGTPGRDNADVLKYNTAAKDVMLSLGIPVIDLYTTSEGLVAEHVNPHDVHYVSAGYTVLAQSIVDFGVTF